MVKSWDRVLFKKLLAFAACIAILFSYFSCSSSAGGGGGGFTITENLPEVYIRGSEYTIVIKDAVSDIVVTKSQSETTIIFTAEDCDSYDWTFEGNSVGNEKACSIETNSFLKGTYTLSLEALKGGRRFSYYAQIKVAN